MAQLPHLFSFVSAHVAISIFVHKHIGCHSNMSTCFPVLLRMKRSSNELTVISIVYSLILFFILLDRLYHRKRLKDFQLNPIQPWKFPSLAMLLWSFVFSCCSLALLVQSASVPPANGTIAERPDAPAAGNHVILHFLSFVQTCRMTCGPTCAAALLFFYELRESTMIYREIDLWMV